ncbi:DUF3515 domain-containing protein [Streptomyces sp. NPDC018031]|uniref:DUF3515 domain-containing protein n=1 Tax=Streptomyces sp. NPDC018031 TaxID=3365033 RepID=UPI0037B8ADAA
MTRGESGPADDEPGRPPDDHAPTSAADAGEARAAGDAGDTTRAGSTGSAGEARTAGNTGNTGNTGDTGEPTKGGGAADAGTTARAGDAGAVRRRRLAVRGAPVVALLLLAAGYVAFGDAVRNRLFADDAVRVAAPVPKAGTEGRCAELIDAVPDELGGAERRETRPATRYTAAWGDPAIVLRCGIPRPDEMNNPRAPGARLKGVDWMLESPDDGSHRCTTALRSVYVEVSIPAAYRDVEALVELGDAVRTTIPAGL